MWWTASPRHLYLFCRSSGIQFIRRHIGDGAAFQTGVNFMLSRPQIQVSQTAFAEILDTGQSKVVPLTVSNPGDAPLDFAAYNPQTGYAWRDSDAPGGPVFAGRTSRPPASSWP